MSIEMTRVLKQIIEKFGIDTLRNGSRTIALFADFAPQCRKEMNMLQYLVKCNGHKLLLDAREASTDEQRAIRRRIISQMTSELMLSEDAALSICDSFWIAIGGSPIKSPVVHIRKKVNYKIVATIIVAAVCFSIALWFATAPIRERNAQLDVIFQEAQTLYSAGNCEEVITYLSNQGSAISERKDLQDLFDTAFYELRDINLSYIYDYLGKTDYIGAFQYIDSLISPIKTDNEIQYALQEVTDQYKAHLFSQADELVEQSSYDEARSLLSASNSYIGDDEQIIQRMNEIDVIEALAYIEICTSKQDYLGALQYIDGLNEQTQSFPDVIDARHSVLDLYGSTVYIEADKARAAGNYLAARDLLATAVVYLPDNANLSQLLALVKEQEAMSIVNNYIAKKQYGDAISYMESNKDLVTSSSQLQGLLQSCKDNFLANVITQAKNAYSSEGYKAAVQVISDALIVLKNNKELIDLRTYYNSLKPVMLTEIEVFSYGNGGEYNDSVNQYTQDRYGNLYSTSFSIEDESTITWILNGQYSTFSGIIACPDGFMYKSHLSNVVVTISCDGETIFTSDEAGPDEKPQSFSIDVSGVEKLQISWNCLPAWNIWSNWCEYGTIFDGTLYPAA